jgi:hypothetical protein
LRPVQLNVCIEAALSFRGDSFQLICGYFFKVFVDDALVDREILVKLIVQ